MESVLTTMGVYPARLDTLAVSLVASVVNANNAARRITPHNAMLTITVTPFFKAFICSFPFHASVAVLIYLQPVLLPVIEFFSIQ